MPPDDSVITRRDCTWQQVTHHSREMTQMFATNNLKKINVGLGCVVLTHVDMKVVRIAFDSEYY